MVSGNLVKIDQNNKLGRFAVAVEDLRPGTIAFEELPFVVGPKPNTTAVCLECCAPIDGTENGAKCQNCNWPMCDDCKLNSSRANHAKECELFVQNKIKYQNLVTLTQTCMQMDCITPLRLLLQKESNPERWEKEVSKMEYHPKERLNSEIWKADKVNIVGYLHGPCKLKDRFSEDLIQQACGILEVNSFEAKTKKGHKIRCIYPRLASLAHCCVPNTSHIILPSKDYKVIVRSAVDIKKNELLNTTYTFTTSGTRARQEHLKNGKFFTCECARCKDPTELGTHFSSLKCQKCKDGSIVSTNPINESAEWKCLSCPFTTPSVVVKSVVTTIESEIAMLSELETSTDNIKSCEDVLKKYLKVLHPNHYLIVSLRENLIDMYGWQLTNKTDNEFIIAECLERKIELCKDVLKVLDVIQPGLNRGRAMTIYEIFTSMGAILKRNWNSVPNRNEYISEAKRLLDECLLVFEWEDEASLEYYLAQMCRKIAQDLQATEEFSLEEKPE